jgi:hypothetical protein
MPKTKPSPSVIPLVNYPLAGTKVARKGNTELPSEAGLGSLAYSDKTMAPYFTQPLGKKGEHGRDKWANTALVLVHRAQKAAQTYGKKDFNALYRLVLSAGIAYDKAWPTQQVPSGNNLIVQLFGSLGSDTAKAILEPRHPIIDVTPLAQPSIANDLDTIVSTPPSNTPTDKPLDIDG